MENGRSSSIRSFFHKGLDTEQSFDTGALVTILDSMKGYLTFRLCDLPSDVSSGLERIKEIIRLFRLSPKYRVIYDIIVNHYGEINLPIGTLGFYLSKQENIRPCIPHISQYCSCKDLAVPRPDDPVTPSATSSIVVPSTLDRKSEAVLLVVYPSNYDHLTPIVTDDKKDPTKIAIIPLNNLDPTKSVRVYHCGYYSPSKSTTVLAVRSYLEPYRANMVQYTINQSHQVVPYIDTRTTDLSSQQIRSLHAGSSGMASASSSSAIWWWVGLVAVILLLIILIWWYLSSGAPVHPCQSTETVQLSPVPLLDISEVKPNS